MRYLATATMAASVLAIGLRIDPAFSLPVGGKLTGADNTVVQVQQQGKGPGGPGGGSPGSSGRGGAAPREPGGGGGMREGRGMRGDGGAQLRSGERSTRGEGRARSERGSRGERGGAEFGYREPDRGGDRARARERDRDRRHGRRGGIYIEPGYGYLPTSCAWLRRRALETDSPYWWRRYRACRG